MEGPVAEKPTLMPASAAHSSDLPTDNKEWPLPATANSESPHQQKNHALPETSKTFEVTKHTSNRGNKKSAMGETFADHIYLMRDYYSFIHTLYKTPICSTKNQF